jgi:hypothetical protein
MYKQTHRNHAEETLTLRVSSCNSFVSHIRDGLFDPKLTFFTDDANSYLLKYVNSRNNRSWNSKNPHTLINFPLYVQKIGVWCAIGTNFIEGNLDADEILSQFFFNLASAEERFSYFIQDGMIPHTVKETIQALYGVFGELSADNRIIKKVCNH